MASEPTVTCPSCKTEIKLTESLAAPLLEATRREYEKRLSDQSAEVARRAKALAIRWHRAEPTVNPFFSPQSRQLMARPKPQAVALTWSRFPSCVMMPSRPSDGLRAGKLFGPGPEQVRHRAFGARPQPGGRSPPIAGLAPSGGCCRSAGQCGPASERDRQPGPSRA